MNGLVVFFLVLMLIGDWVTLAYARRAAETTREILRRLPGR